MRNDKYSGLRNLGATCYINSLLQQVHKNTLLGPMLCNKDIIQIDRKQPLFQFVHLMSSMSHSLKNTINPIEFIKSVRFHGSEEINPLVQQDVNEFFLAFVDLL
jgi:ubiquitin C-terminal hydrolase